MPRDIIHLVCQDCKRKNYTTTKNKRRTPDKLELKKYLPVLWSTHSAPRR